MAADRNTAESGTTAQSPFATFAMGLLRLVNTLLLAAAVWVLWLIVDRLDKLTGEVINLIDYLSVIAERLG